MDFVGMTGVYGTEYAFTALYKSTGAALCWREWLPWHWLLSTAGVAQV